MDPDFLDLMPDTVTVEPFKGNRVDGYPGGSFGAKVVYPAYVQWQPKEVRSLQGDDVTSSCQAYIDCTRQVVGGKKVALSPAAVISPKDHVTLPDGSTPLIIRVDRLSDERGAYAAVIYT